MKVVVLGGGAIGQAISSVIDEAKVDELVVWDKRNPATGDLQDAVANAELVFLCIPSYAIREVLDEAKTSLSNNCNVVSLSKGLDETTGKLVPDVLAEFLPEERYGILSGPMIAEEIISGEGGVGVLASVNENVVRLVDSVVKPNRLRLEYSDDVFSIALSGVLKNVYTLAIGIVVGLQYGKNIIGWMVSCCINEQLEILSFFQGDPDVILNSPGLGDFVATSISKHSFNREAGIKIAQELAPPASEGVISLEHLLDRLDGMSSNLPVLESLREVVQGGANAEQVFNRLIYGE